MMTHWYETKKSPTFYWSKHNQSTTQICARKPNISRKPLITYQQQVINISINVTDLTYSSLTLKMASAQVVETSVTSNSPSQDYIHPDDHITSINIHSPGFRPFIIIQPIKSGGLRDYSELVSSFPRHPKHFSILSLLVLVCESDTYTEDWCNATTYEWSTRLL